MNTKQILLSVLLMLTHVSMQAQIPTRAEMDSIFIALCEGYIDTVAELDEHIVGAGANVVGQSDAMPTFPGGKEALSRVLSRNLTYPEKERKNGVQGRVIVSFIVQTNGKVGDVKVMKSVSPGLDAEAVRVVKLLRGWNPGMKDGQPVNTRYSLPVNFKL